MPVVTWFFNEEELVNSCKYQCTKRGNQHTLLLTNVDQSNEGIITCFATNEVGNARSRAMLAVITTAADNQNTIKTKALQSHEILIPETHLLSQTSLVFQDRSDVEYSSTATVSQSDFDAIPHEFKPNQKIKKLRVGKKHAKGFSTSGLDWTEEVRKLIREELDAKEKEKQALEISLKQNEEKTKPASYAPNFVQCISDCRVHAGETAHFVYILTAEPSAKVLWLRNGTPMFLRDNTRPESEAHTATDGNIGFISDSCAGCLVISETDSSHIGIYTCVASNVCGSTKCSANLFIEEVQKNSNKVFDADNVHLVDQESQTFESRIEDEDQMITDAFIELKTAEKMQTIQDIVINDTKIATKPVDFKCVDNRDKHNPSSKKTKCRKKSQLSDHGRMDDNETGEGLKTIETHCTYT